MAKERSKKFWLIIGFIVFVPINYAVWLNWSENVDRRLKNLESKVDSERVIAHEENKIDKERHVISDAATERYLCVADNTSYFTQIPDQQNCRVSKLTEGWKNLYFSKEQIFDYYEGDLSRTGNEVKVWARILTSSPRMDEIQQYNGMKNQIKLDEVKSLFVFDCSAKVFKNPNVVYFLNGKKLLSTTGNRTTIMSNGLTSYSYDDKVEQIEPGTFVDALYKEICFKPKHPPIGSPQER
ncbi:MAG: hypothetical protein IT559_04645 [Alphaproteobacteria bacterium]|nr:hypothetical protein [Alphaproteobacteria bacterium]